MISLCFDDGRIACFKWCRYLHKLGIKAVLYINPDTIGTFEYLNTYHLDKIQNEWGHLIGNHLFSHSDCPANHVSLVDIIKSYNRTKVWLVEKGYGGMEEYVALPFGCIGGRWSDVTILKLLEHCKQVRDVSSVGVTDMSNTRRLYGVCDDIHAIKLGVRNTGPMEDKVLTIVLHGNNFMTDDDFLFVADLLVEYKEYLRTVNEFQEVKNEIPKVGMS